MPGVSESPISSMIGVVARKELKSLFRDGRIRLTGVIVVVMLIVAVATAVQRYIDISAERSAAQALVTEQWQAQGEKNPHAAAHYGLHAFKPVTPLTFFDTGVTNFEGVSIWLGAHRRNRADARPADDMTAMARFGELTGAYVLQVFMPLLIILIAFSSIAGEREQGTLRQVLSTGIRPGALVIGKALGALTAVGLILGPLLLIALIALVFAPSGTTYLPQALLMLLFYAVFAVVYVLICLAVSARARSAQFALVVLVGFWVVTTFAVPRFAVDLGAYSAAVPSAAQLQSWIDEDIQSGLDGISPAAVIEERRQKTLALYNAQSVDELPINFQGIVFSLQEELGGQVYDKHFSELGDTFQSQIDLFEVAGLLSPRIPVQLISMELAGTSISDHLAFSDHAEVFRREMIELMNQDITLNSQPGETAYRAGPALWEKIGEYQPATPTLADALGRLGPALMTLTLWLIAGIGAAWVAVRRLSALAA